MFSEPFLLVLDTVYKVFLFADLEVGLPAFAGQVETVHGACLIVVEET